MDDLDLLMYLDEGLVKNLTSLFLTGYIDIRTTRLTQDTTLTGRFSTDSRKNVYDEDREGLDEREGYKGTSISKAAHCEEGMIQGGFIEDREFFRREEEIKKIYTTFTLHHQLQSQLTEINKIRAIGNDGIEEGSVKAGDYVKVNGILTSESVNSYIDVILNMFSCYGCENLNTLLSNNNVPNTSSPISILPKNLLNFNTLNNILSHLHGILSENSTQDMILKCGNDSVILTVNKNFFMNNNAYIFDKINCPCTVFGKVINVVDKGNCISLLRKTAQHEYYENILNHCDGYYCDTLRSSGIILPSQPRLRCEGTSIVVLPISMSI